MGTVNSEEQLKRIADYLESIDKSLEIIEGSISNISMQSDALSDLSKCINSHHQFCIAGSVTSYEG